MKQIEELSDFEERMDCGPPIWVRDERYLFSNGAMSYGINGPHLEPPKNPVELLALKIEYAGTVLEREVDAYMQALKAIELQNNFFRAGHGASVEQQFGLKWKEQLEAKAANIEKLRAELFDLQNQTHANALFDQHLEDRMKRNGQADVIAHQLASLPMP